MMNDEGRMMKGKKGKVVYTKLHHSSFDLHQSSFELQKDDGNN